MLRSSISVACFALLAISLAACGGAPPRVIGDRDVIGEVLKPRRHLTTTCDQTRQFILLGDDIQVNIDMIRSITRQDNGDAKVYLGDTTMGFYYLRGEYAQFVWDCLQERRR